MPSAWRYVLYDTQAIPFCCRHGMVFSFSILYSNIHSTIPKMSRMHFCINMCCNITYIIGVKNINATSCGIPSHYMSKLSSLRRKSKRPIVSIPSSLRRGMMWSLTMIIFLKESLMFISERDSCISFSLFGMDKADCT